MVVERRILVGGEQRVLRTFQSLACHYTKIHVFFPEIIQICFQRITTSESSTDLENDPGFPVEPNKMMTRYQFARTSFPSPKRIRNSTRSFYPSTIFQNELYL